MQFLTNMKVESLVNSSGTPLRIDELATPVIGKVTGVYAKLDSMSVNGRFYSAEFWKKVLSSSRVLDALTLGKMLGVFEHPSMTSTYTKDGLITARHPSNAAFITKKLEVMDNGDIYGTSYLLNTPLGRLLGTYLLAKDDNGAPLVQVHMSARGYSKKDYIDKNGIDQMNPDDYYLQAFDAVITPGIAGTNIKFESDDTSSASINKLTARVIEVDKRLIRSSIIDELKLKSKL